MTNPGRFIMHIDANSAYLSWEAVYRLQHGDPIDLRTIPAVIGGDPKTRHGIVLTKSIPAKKYKILTGETLYAALQKCPRLTIVQPNYSLYMQCSQAMVDILRQYSPSVQRYSVDECFLDYTGCERLFGDPLTAAGRIKDHIKNELGFTVNIGVAHNKLLAKMASELKKPDMVHTMWEDEIPAKLWPLPVEEMFGVGRATGPKLRSRGIYTIGDLAKADREMLRLWLKSYGLLLHGYANGLETSPVHKGNWLPLKGIGNSTTIPFDVDNAAEAHLALLSLTETVAMRLRRHGLLARLVSVHVRNSDMLSYGHQHKMDLATDCTMAIHREACRLFDSIWQGEPLRHLGVRVSELCTSEMLQISIFDAFWEKQKAADQAVDLIRQRFGPKALIRSSFLFSGLKPLTGGVGDEGEYPLMASIL